MSTTTPTDHSGETITARHAETAERYDNAVRSMLLLADGVSDAWDATVADEPDFALGQIGRAYLRCLSSEAPDAHDALVILDGLGDRPDLSDRERRHLDAARAYATGDLAGAAERLAALSVDHPRDALALAVGHQLDFFCGDARSLRDRVGRTMLSWDEAHPFFGFVLGMQAFGLEECGLYEQAETAGMRALDIGPNDVWALHAVVHVHEMRGRVDTGLRLMDERRADWTTGNFFVVHNSWHEALFHLERGDLDAALAIYDSILHHDGSAPVALEMLDAAALLWRLHLDGADTGGRWAPLADAWAAKAGEPWYSFNDADAAMSFVGAGRLGDARALVDRLDAYAVSGQAATVTNVGMTIDVGLPVCRAVLAFGEERYADSVTELLPIRNVVQRFGGSHAQRDAVARTLLEAAIRAGDDDLALALVSERLALKDSAYSRRQLSRIRAA